LVKKWKVITGAARMLMSLLTALPSNFGLIAKKE